MEENLLKVENLSVEFPDKKANVEAVKQVSFQLRKGEILGIIGESGSGKTVLSKGILGLVPFPGQITSGTVWYKGEELDLFNERKMKRIRGKEIAYLIQNPMSAFNPMFSVRHHIKTALAKEEAKMADERIHELLQEVRITMPGKCYPHQFSGGMLQRAALAMAIAGKPNILIADEPTTALDVDLRKDILHLIREVAEKEDMSVLLITHDFTALREISSKVIVMYAGMILETGTLEVIYENPAHPYTKLLIYSAESMRHQKELEEMNMREDERSGVCPFYARCPDAKEKCRTTMPEETYLGQEHFVRCHNF